MLDANVCQYNNRCNSFNKVLTAMAHGITFLWVDRSHNRFFTTKIALLRMIIIGPRKYLPEIGAKCKPRSIVVSSHSDETLENGCLKVVKIWQELDQVASSIVKSKTISWDLIPVITKSYGFGVLPDYEFKDIACRSWTGERATAAKAHTPLISFKLFC